MENKQATKIERNLERLYKTALAQEDKLDFFKGINAYAEYVLETPILKAIVDEQMAERAARYEKIDQAEEQAVKELLSSKDKLLAIIKDKGINPSDFVRYTTFLHDSSPEIIAELGAFERREIIKGNFLSDGYESYLYDIAANLLKMGFEKELGEMVATKEQYRDYYQHINGGRSYGVVDNMNGRFILSQTWPEKFAQVALLEKERALKPWAAFEKIIQLKCAFDAAMQNASFWRIEDAKSEYIHFFKVEDRVTIGCMFEDLYHLMGQMRADSPTKFRDARQHSSSPFDRLNVVMFKNATQTVHNLLMQKVDFEAAEKQGKPVIESFDEKKGVLIFAGHEVELSKKGKETDAVLLMKTLLKAEGNEWKHNDEILSDWGYSDDDQKDASKNKVYYAAKKINTAVAVKTQIADFIECNTTKARINPKYQNLDE